MKKGALMEIAIQSETDLVVGLCRRMKAQKKREGLREDVLKVNETASDRMTCRDGLKSGPLVARIFCLTLPGCCLPNQVHFLAHLCTFVIGSMGYKSFSQRPS